MHDYPDGKELPANFNPETGKRNSRPSPEQWPDPEVGQLYRHESGRVVRVGMVGTTDDGKVVGLEGPVPGAALRTFDRFFDEIEVEPGVWKPRFTREGEGTVTREDFIKEHAPKLKILPEEIFAAIFGVPTEEGEDSSDNLQA